jgi:TrkA domain protein
LGRVVKVEESSLPGVGKRVFFRHLENGNALAVVTLEDGRKEIYIDPDGVDPTVIRLSADEARVIGQSIVSEFLPKTVIDYMSRIVQGGLQMDQVTITPDSPVAGQTVVDTKLRSESGALILAVLRGGQHVYNPPPTTVLQPGDVLVMVGDEGQMRRAQKILSGA